MVNNGYDANGNMTSTQSMTGLVYDVENRLVSAPAHSQNVYPTGVYAMKQPNVEVVAVCVTVYQPHLEKTISASSRGRVGSAR